MKQKYPIVRLHCRDQAFYSSVDDPRSTEYPIVEMIIVGHLLLKDEEKVVVAFEFFDDHDVRYVSSVPIQDVIELEVLREQDKD